MLHVKPSCCSRCSQPVQLCKCYVADRQRQTVHGVQVAAAAYPITGLDYQFSISPIDLDLSAAGLEVPYSANGNVLWYDSSDVAGHPVNVRFNHPDSPTMTMLPGTVFTGIPFDTLYFSWGASGQGQEDDPPADIIARFRYLYSPDVQYGHAHYPAYGSQTGVTVNVLEDVTYVRTLIPSVLTSGTRVEIAAFDLDRRNLIFRAPTTNTGILYWGDEDATELDGIPILPGEIVTLDTPSSVWVWNPVLGPEAQEIRTNVLRIVNADPI